MARDYVKRPKRKASRKSVSSKQKHSVAPWTWLVTGLLMGLVIAAIAYLKITVLPSSGAKPVIQAQATPKSVPKKENKKASVQKTAAKAPPPPKFDFYTLLPEMEVAVSDPPKPKPVAAPAASADPVLAHPLDQVKYRLQIDSFNRYEDADTL